ncbi:hypothetical protein D3C73_540490 [compost metagenome]
MQSPKLHVITFVGSTLFRNAFSPFVPLNTAPPSIVIDWSAVLAALFTSPIRSHAPVNKKPQLIRPPPCIMISLVPTFILPVVADAPLNQVLISVNLLILPKVTSSTFVNSLLMIVNSPLLGVKPTAVVPVRIGRAISYPLIIPKEQLSIMFLRFPLDDPLLIVIIS